MSRLHRRRFNRPAAESSSPSTAPSTATPPPSPAPAPTRAANNERPTRVRRTPPPVEGAMGIPQWTALIQEFPDYVQAFVERGILLYNCLLYTSPSPRDS